MTMKTKKTLQHIAAVAVVLLTLCLVFMMPAMAITWETVDSVNTTTVSSADELKAALTEIEAVTAPVGKYEIKLSAGNYELSELQINQHYDKSVLLNGTGTEKPVIKGKVKINGNRKNDNPETLTFKNIKFDGSGLTSDGATGVIYFMNGASGYAHHVSFIDCEIVGPGKGTVISGIFIPGNDGYVYGLALDNVQISNCFSPVNGKPRGDVSITNCDFTNSYEGVNFGDGSADSITIQNSKISADSFAIRVSGVDNSGDLTITGNTLESQNADDSNNKGNKATIVFRNSFPNGDVDITSNIITGGTEGLLMMMQSGITGSSDSFDLSNNYWQGGAEPTGEQLGGISFAAGTSYYTELEADGTIDTSSSATAIGDSVAEVNGVYYDNLQYALKNLTTGGTFTLLKDVTITEYWDNRYTGGKITVPVTIDGNGYSITFTNTVYDAGNQMSAFRFEADATVKNLTIDMSEAKSGWGTRLRAISAKTNLNVDNCTFIGNSSLTQTRGIIFGEGALGAIGNLEVSITNSEFKNWTRGVTDNENAQDAKSVTLTGNTFENADAWLSAHETVIFTGNTMKNGAVNIKSYSTSTECSVTATGNTLDEGQDNVIKDVKSCAADAGFKTPDLVIQIGNVYYASLQDAVDAAAPGATITLSEDVTVANLVIGKSLIIDGYGKKLTGMVNLSSTEESIDVTLKNITVDGGSLYAVKVGTKANLIIDGATLTGWNAVYVSQAGQTNPEAHGDGSTVTIKNSELSGKNTYNGASNDFGTVVVFANSTKVEISGSTLKASATGTANQSIIRFGASADKEHIGSSVNIVSSNLEVIANTVGTGIVSIYSIGSGEHGGLTFTLGDGVISNVNPSAYIAKGMEVVQPGNLYKVQTYVDRSGITTKPVDPETPVDPEQPEEPVDPETPVNPETPDDSELPPIDDPEIPETPAPLLGVLAALGAAVVLRRK